MSLNNASSQVKQSVCHITTVHVIDDIRILHKECFSLAEGGYDVHLIACHTGDEVRDKINIHALPFPPGRIVRITIWPLLAFWKIMQLERRPIICHFHDPELLPLGQLLKLFGFKVIFDVHENVADQIRYKRYLNPVVSFLFSKFYRFLERILCFRMASIHVLDSIANNYPQPRQVVRNLPRLGVPSQPTKQREVAVCRLIYVGNVTIDRGALTMVKVAAELSDRGLDFELYLVGGYENSGLLDQSVAMIRDAGIEDKVVITGKQPYAEAQALIQTSDIGLCLLHAIPNHMNSLSTKLLEYMRMELPVVASDFECWREFVADIESGLMVNVESINEISDAVEELILDKVKRVAMGANGLRAVNETLNWETEQVRLLAFYERVIGGGTALGNST